MQKQTYQYFKIDKVWSFLQLNLFAPGPHRIQPATI